MQSLRSQVLHQFGRVIGLNAGRSSVEGRLPRGFVVLRPKPVHVDLQTRLPGHCERGFVEIAGIESGHAEAEPIDQLRR